MHSNPRPKKKSIITQVGLALLAILAIIFVANLLFRYFVATMISDYQTLRRPEQYVVFKNFDNHTLSSENDVEFATLHWGDFSEDHLIERAWQEFGNNNLKNALAYTMKCIEFYESEARIMQSNLYDYPEYEYIRQFNPLNAVATALLIQGKIYEKRGMTEEANGVYNRITKDFSFGQAWDNEKEVLIRIKDEIK